MRTTTIFLVTLLYGFTVVLGQDTNERGTPIEWGRAYRMEIFPIQDLKRPGILATPLVISLKLIENLATANKFYYCELEVYDGADKQTKTVSLTEQELSEAIGFCTKLSDYGKQVGLKHYVEYSYETAEQDFGIGIFWNTKDLRWSFVVTIDPAFKTETKLFFETSMISQFFQGLMSCKATIDRLKK